MLKGIFWLVVLFVLMGGGMRLIALMLFLAITGFVLKMFLAPFTTGGTR
jgi:hypothetical protein